MEHLEQTLPHSSSSAGAFTTVMMFISEMRKEMLRAVGSAAQGHTALQELEAVCSFYSPPPYLHL